MKALSFIIVALLLFSTGGLKAQKKEKIQDGDGVFFKVEEMPEFPGGEQALRDYIAGNIKYPEQAKKDSIMGKVFISFVIDTAGRVEEAKVVRGVHPLLDNESLRVIRSMPAWIPGKEKGKPVKVAYTIPVAFLLR
jgi:TonB family protein